ncbi:DASS family sodium-coupled anion symporter [Endozoicomonas gorgoniicola]|uniref:DASS family sodium-coupled anion symporter n=1 Tax=Endozoicomonas gorgoniicola TaxID=1234144 RepID=A0ABT3N286_9GAMM|nr:DASS family sodium-coupled anion symporter [Endozoicomonas gorgoniicola]MCW7555736.1 DASS family sodium-coupled anion symporter [Endozoicomonas gorgoniicola]
MTTATSVFTRGAPGLSYWVSLFTGPILLLLTIITPPPQGMTQDAWYMVGVATLMAVWWVSEVVPIPVTALTPIAVVPLLGVASIREVTAPFANPTIYLFFGGFMLGVAMERWNLHKRIALNIMLATGVKPSRQVAGFMVATAFLSMWVSNTATSAMMLPIGLSVAAMMSGSEEGRARFAKMLLLAIAYSASIGGLATLIGTPPNALLAAFLSETYNIDIGFAQWMMVGLPISFLMLVATWLWLTKVSFRMDDIESPDARKVLKEQLDDLGAMTRGEKTIGIIFALTALAWIFRPLLKGYIPGLSDTGIAVAAAISLFIVPVNRDERIYVLTWEKAREIPWGVLLLFGGGLTLAALIKSTGLANWIADAMSIVGGLPILLVVAFVVTVIIFLTELTSNTATAAGFLPLMGALGVSLGIDPTLLAVPAALAASCAFMMPVATPPNAIVFGSGKLEIGDMIKAGFALNIIGIILVTLTGYYLASTVLIQ